MVRYFYAWTPAVVVATVVVLSIPYLALIVLMVVLVAAAAGLAALAWLIVATLFGVGRSALGRPVRRRRQERSSAPQPIALRPGGVERGGAG